MSRSWSVASGWARRWSKNAARGLGPGATPAGGTADASTHRRPASSQPKRSCTDSKASSTAAWRASSERSGVRFVVAPRPRMAPEAAWAPIATEAGARRRHADRARQPVAEHRRGGALRLLGGLPSEAGLGPVPGADDLGAGDGTAEGDDDLRAVVVDGGDERGHVVVGRYGCHGHALYRVAGGRSRARTVARSWAASISLLPTSGTRTARRCWRRSIRAGSRPSVPTSPPSSPTSPTATARDHAVALASGTAALFLALRELGVGPGDEVVVATHTFVGSVGPVVHLGATPVFVDSDAASWTMSPALLADALDAADEGRHPRRPLRSVRRPSVRSPRSSRARPRSSSTTPPKRSAPPSTATRRARRGTPPCSRSTATSS